MTFVLMTEAPPEWWVAEQERQASGPPRCHCGRFVSRGKRCSLEIRVYRGGTFAGWEHY